MNIGGIALAVSAVALGLAIYGLSGAEPYRERAPGPSERGSGPIAELERQVIELRRELASYRARLPGRGAAEAAEPGVAGGAEDAAVPVIDGGENPAELAKDGDALAAIVDSAVDKKTKKVLDELRMKANKKPDIDAFASVLELSKRQRTQAEQVVAEGQREMHTILDIPAADGSNLMDELVEIAARGMAQPGRDHGWGKWFARVMSEKIPGTDETYATRIDAVKKRMHESFQRDWSEAQYKEFAEWGVDPMEVQNVPNSPNVELYRRITERARRLGAKIPEEDD